MPRLIVTCAASREAIAAVKQSRAVLSRGPPLAIAETGRAHIDLGQQLIQLPGTGDIRLILGRGQRGGIVEHAGTLRLSGF